MRALLALALALVALAGCGDAEVVREREIVVTGEAPRAQGPATPDGAIRIAVVTHGQASSPFWAIVRNGVESAARQMDVLVDYQAPEVYDLEEMREMIDEAVASRPDGLVVSIPEDRVARSIRRATRAGIPVVSINSGSDVALSLGVLSHVGQLEEQAGLRAGRKLAAAGVRRALCVNQQVGNQGLDARCRGLARAMRAAGGHSLVLGVDDQADSTVRRIATALEGGRIAFAVDQQPYLQGYWPIAMLAQRARFGVFPEEGEVIATGPNFVDTSEEAERALELSKRSIR